MRGACKEHIDDLPLYAEGELDPRKAEAIRIHLRFCEGCRAWIARYDDFTREILEADLGPSGIAPWDGSAGATRDSGSPAGSGTDFAGRVMAGVSRAARAGRLSRWSRLAAAAAVIAGLGAGTATWLSTGTGGPADAPSLAGPAAVKVSPPETLAASSTSGREREEARPDLASAWWVIDPEREPVAAWDRLETILYSILDGGDRAPGRENEFLVLRGLLGHTVSGGGDSSLFMVSEGGAERIPLRPVARPLRVSGREIAGPTRIRLQSPSRRYRIIWLGGDRFPVGIPETASPDALPLSAPSPVVPGDLPFRAQ